MIRYDEEKLFYVFRMINNPIFYLEVILILRYILALIQVKGHLKGKHNFKNIFKIICDYKIIGSNINYILEPHKMLNSFFRFSWINVLVNPEEVFRIKLLFNF